MKKIRDERTIQLANKIYSEAYFVSMCLLILSVTVKTYILNQPFSRSIAELGIIALSTVYILIRSMLTGSSLISTSKQGKILSTLAILGLSCAATISNGIRNYSIYGERYSGIFDPHFLAVLAFTFVSSAALTSVAFLFLSLCNKKSQQKIEKEIFDHKD